jgi:sulfur-oxidizing protein SoxZ
MFGRFLMSTAILTRLAFAGLLKAGGTVEARWSAAHPMDSGFRVDDSGQKIPRNIIHTVKVLVNEQLILEAELGTAMTSPVYLAFPVQVPAGGGMVRVLWIDDTGQAGETTQRLVI